jgi:hypothetical protein
VRADRRSGCAVGIRAAELTALSPLGKGQTTLTAYARRYKNGKMPISQNDTLHLAREFLRRIGSGAEPAEIAKLFSENMEWEIAGDTGVMPWIRQKSGRAAVTDFVKDSRALIER